MKSNSKIFLIGFFLFVQCSSFLPDECPKADDWLRGENSPCVNNSDCDTQLGFTCTNITTQCIDTKNSNSLWQAQGQDNKKIITIGICHKSEPSSMSSRKTMMALVTK